LREFFGNPALDVPSPSYLLQFTYSDADFAIAPEQEPKATSETPADTASAGEAVGQTFRAGTASLVPGCPVYHLDPYRLPEGKIATLMDFDEIFAAIALVEWPDRLGEMLVQKDSPPRLEIVFEGFGPGAQGRSVQLSGVGRRWRELVASWARKGGEAASAMELTLAPTLQETDLAAGLPSRVVQKPEQKLPGAFSAVPDLRQFEPDPSKWRVLGIESSCDDTGAAVLNGLGQILGEALASQAGIHEVWGGVVPRLAQEAHRAAIDATVEEALQRSGVSAADLSAVAVTVGPGLGLCLEVGVRKALQIAARHRLPLVRVHHMEAHAMVARLPTTAKAVSKAAPAAQSPTAAHVDAPAGPQFPFLTLLVSGGHNLAVLSRGLGQHLILGSTIDDSIGEAFDKTARALGITQVPGGPHLERLAKEGDVEVYRRVLPKPLSKTRDPVLKSGCDFSFSGLKTSVRTLVEKELSKVSAPEIPEAETRQTKANIAAAFQHVAVEHLCQRATRAAEWAKELEPGIKSLIIAGGVAANQAVRKGLTEVAEAAGITMQCPPPRLCVDNGVMVAWAGIERLRLGLFEAPPSEAGVEHAVEIRPRWPLGERDSRGHISKHPKGQKRRFSGPSGGAHAPQAKRLHSSPVAGGPCGADEAAAHEPAIADAAGTSSATETKMAAAAG